MDISPNAQSRDAGDGALPRDCILATTELERRPRRAPDHAAELRTLGELAQALADAPATIFPRLAEAMREALQADSAGISLLATEGDRFHWVAIAGAWQPHTGGGTPRDFGPCGDVLDLDAPQLFQHPERRYTYLAAMSPPIVECLMLPIRVRGEVVGTIWVMAHTAQRRFDAEDLRRLLGLARFAAAAHAGALEIHRGRNGRRAALDRMEDARRTHDAMQALNAELRLREAQSARNANALAKLHELSSRLWRMRDLGEGMDELLAVTLELLGADMGNIQVVDECRGTLVIVAQRGFRREFLDHFREVSIRDDCACGRALRLGQRTIVEDVDADPGFAPHRFAARAAGFRAVQSTPMVGRDGVVLGVISTHFRIPHRPDEMDLRRLDLYVRQAADFIEHKRAEVALRTSEVRYRGLFESAKDGILVLDSHTARITDANPYVCELLGYTHDELLDKDLGELGLFRDRETSLAALHELRRRKFLRFDDLPLVTKDGQRLDVEFMGNIYREGEVSVVQCNIRDITERKRLENDLRKYAADLSEADRRKNEFLAMLAHELRNPLAPIRNAARVMRLTGGAGEMLDTASQMLERQVDQMVRLVDDLLDVSRISSGKIELRLGMVEVTPVIQQAVEAARGLAESPGHQLELTQPRKPMFVNADPARLVQMVGNLLTNACKFTERGGRIEVEVEREDQQVAIRVRDNGIGIAEEQRARIFDMFMQLDTSLERTTGGLGIGLPLVKTLVEMHGGSIDVQSDGIGHGTTFTLRLPLLTDARQPAPAEPAPEHPARATSSRVLVVDDNIDSASSLALLLEMSGHTTQIAHDGLEAVKAAKAFKPDIVLLDIGLPHLNGFEAASRIRKSAWGRDVILVALTGWGQNEDRERSRAAGFDAHLLKPVDYDVLMGLLADLQSS